MNVIFSIHLYDIPSLFTYFSLAITLFLCFFHSIDISLLYYAAITISSSHTDSNLFPFNLAGTTLPSFVFFLPTYLYILILFFINRRKNLKQSRGIIIFFFIFFLLGILAIAIGIPLLVMMTLAIFCKLLKYTKFIGTIWFLTLFL